MSFNNVVLYSPAIAYSIAVWKYTPPDRERLGHQRNGMKENFIKKSLLPKFSNNETLTSEFKRRIGSKTVRQLSRVYSFSVKARNRNFILNSNKLSLCESRIENCCRSRLEYKLCCCLTLLFATFALAFNYSLSIHSF